MISNQTSVQREFDFEITRMISDQIALHSFQLPLSIDFAHGLRSMSSTEIPFYCDGSYESVKRKIRNKKDSLGQLLKGSLDDVEQNHVISYFQFCEQSYLNIVCC